MNRSVFAPDNFTEHKSVTQTGVIPCTAFAQLIETKATDPQLIMDFPVHTEFCQEITKEYLLQLVMETHTEYGSEWHLLYPALTHQSPPRDQWQPPFYLGQRAIAHTQFFKQEVSTRHTAISTREESCATFRLSQ